jgi:predicted secreted hydrolase
MKKGLRTTALVLALIVAMFVIFIGTPISTLINRLDPQSDTPPPPPVNTGGSRLSQLLGDEDVTGYATATEPRTFEFPADHGPHQKFRNEWWYLTGNLDGQNGERFGYELTIFRFLLAPNKERQQASRWQSDHVYIGHFAVTDVKNEQFHVAERFSRGSMGLAGAQAEPFRVWVEDWSITAGPDEQLTWRIQAQERDVSLDLNLTPLKPPVLNGQNGLSQKSAEPGNASYYYSISRLQTEGFLKTGTQRFSVTGFSWLDREWSSSALSEDQVGWDWFALQLDDGSDLMFYQLRRLDGSKDPLSAGTWVDRSGNSTHLDADEVKIEITDFWDSPLGGRYPSGWQVNIPGKDVQLDVRPVIDDQELNATVRYWEGAVNVGGNRNGDKLDGRGYVELTGYAGIAETE